MQIWYGGDYNPEQWPREVWDEDVRLMRQSGVNLATVGVFSWSWLEPQEGDYDFEWLDTVLDKLRDGGIGVDLATATASPPPWLTHKYPDVLPITVDGIRLYPGSRQQFCPSSPTYRRLAGRLVRAIAERYGNHPALELWHVGNEYGCHVSHCYCDVSAVAFRGWLEHKYGSVEALNAAWGTAFWSQRYGSFEEVHPPRTAPTFRNPGQLLDFDRFSSGELLECYRAERAILSELSPGVPVTTNFLGFRKQVDYWAWAQEVDVVSYDNYPQPTDPNTPATAAMSHDLMRSLRRGQPWLLMEQAPSAVSWFPQNQPKAPGQQRAQSYQALARGADGIMFFQWRQSVSGAEKFLSGMVPHAGTATRVWREVEQLGHELGSLDKVVGSRLDANVAIVLDWDSWRSIEQQAVPSQLSYVDGLSAWHRDLYERNVLVDFVRPVDDLTGYDLVIVPSLFVASETATANLDAYVRAGGHLLVTYQTAITGENARISPGGYLGGLQQTLGIWIEEFAPLAGADRDGDGKKRTATVSIAGDIVGRTEGELWSEFLHLSGAEAVARFTGGALAEWPAVTRNKAGSGIAWYVATLPEAKARGALIDHLLEEAAVVPPLIGQGLEVVDRGGFRFVINHGAEDFTLESPSKDWLTGLASRGTTLSTHGVALLADLTSDGDPAADYMPT